MRVTVSAEVTLLWFSVKYELRIDIGGGHFQNVVC